MATSQTISTSPPNSLPASPSFSVHRSSSSSSSSRPTLSLDLSNLPPLSQPSPPSNTLLITGLDDLYLFQPSSLTSIREQIQSISPLNSFSPLPSMRRIVCSFLSDEDAIRVRSLLDTQPLLNRHIRTKIYFGERTPILDANAAPRPRLLEAPHLDRLFFISPPPSPPHDWVLRTEEPPNKDVHAVDLAQALAKLKTDQSATATAADPDTPLSIKRTGSWPASAGASMPGQRSRSSTLIYHPEDHGGSPDLPAVMVEDTSASIDGDDVDVDVEMSPIELSVRKMPRKTTRPPVELM